MEALHSIIGIYLEIINICRDLCQLLCFVMLGQMDIYGSGSKGTISGNTRMFLCDAMYCTACPRKSGPREMVCPPINSVLKKVVILINLNATSFSYHLPKTGVHLMGYFYSYDFKCKLQCQTTFTTFCNCFVCG